MLIDDVLLIFLPKYRYSNVDMCSQEAYEKAVQGLLGPDGKSLPILTGLRCIRFEPPNFTLGKLLNSSHRKSKFTF